MNKYFIIIFASFLLSCSTTGNMLFQSPVNITINKNVEIKKPKRILFLYLNCDSRYNNSLCNDIRDKIENELLINSFDVLDRNFIETSLKEQSLSLSGLTEENMLKVGKMLSAEAILIAELASRGNMRLKLVSTETGQIIMKIDSYASTGKIIQSMSKEFNK